MLPGWPSVGGVFSLRGKGGNSGRPYPMYRVLYGVVPAIPTSSVAVSRACRNYFLDDQGSLEIVGHRTGNRKGSARSSGLSLASLEERTGERRGSVAKVDASAAKDAAAERAVAGVDAGSPEEEDGVMLGGSGELS